VGRARNQGTGVGVASRSIAGLDHPRGVPGSAGTLAPFSLAPDTRWLQFQERPSYVRGRSGVDLGSLLHAYGLFSRSGRDMDMPGQTWETLLAEVTGGTQLCGDGGKLAHDVVATSERAGWQTKTVEWSGARRGRLVLGLVAPREIPDHAELPAPELAKRVLENFAVRFEDSCDRLGIEDSRLAVLARLPKDGVVHYFEEPFYPSEVDPCDLEWSKREGSLAGHRDGRLVLEWYFGRGQLRYHLRVPPHAVAIDIPAPLPTDAYVAAGSLGEALQAGRESDGKLDSTAIRVLARRLRAGDLRVPTASGR